MPDCFIAASEKMKGVFDFIERAAPTDAPVLIFGESGTGKELVAGALQEQSTRSSRPYYKLNCATLTPNLLASELFGYERGAFTGADRLKTGKFEQANGGTLFLDEIAELDPQAQAMLLRVLEEGEVDRLGGGKPIKVDVRIIAASNRDLSQAVRCREFRRDLYYRLAVLRIAIPPLRERKDDIPALTRHFVERFSRSRRVPVTSLSAEAQALLHDYDWPGNVRELRNAVHHAVVMCPKDVIDAKHILPALQSGSMNDELPEEILAGDIRLQIIRAYATNYSVAAIARMLGVHPKYLPRLLKRNGLEYLKRRTTNRPGDFPASLRRLPNTS